MEDEETGLIIWLKDSYGFLGLKGDGKGSGRVVWYDVIGVILKD